MQFGSKGIISLASAVFLLTACGGGGGSSGGSVGTGGTPSVGESSLSVSSSSASSSVKPLVKTIAKEDFFSTYGFYPGMYKLELGSVGDFDVHTVDARIVMNEVWNPSTWRWSFSPVVDWCGDLASNGMVSKRIEQGDLPVGKFTIDNSFYTGSDDKHHLVNFAADVVSPKVIKGTRFLSLFDESQSLTLTWQSDEMNYTGGYADFTTSNAKVPKVQSTSVCYSSREEKSDIAGELVSVTHHGFILVPRKPEDGGIAVSAVDEYIAEFHLGTNFDPETAGSGSYVEIELWGFGVGDWQRAESTLDDSVLDEGALAYVFDIKTHSDSDFANDFSAKGEIVLSKLKSAK